MKYYLTQIYDNDNIYESLEITENEYTCFCSEIKKKRANEIVQSIKQLSEMIGIENTKTIVRSALREL